MDRTRIRSFFFAFSVFRVELMMFCFISRVTPCILMLSEVSEYVVIAILCLQSAIHRACMA
jgi:hypothetical protein